MPLHRPRPVRAACGALLALGLLACHEDVDTVSRTLPSGRQVDISHLSTRQGKTGLRLHYVYVSSQLDDMTAFAAEWAEVAEDAQRDAGKVDAVEVLLIAHRRGGSPLSRAFTLNEWVTLYRKQNGRWTAENPKR
jgi:hypothetical protein